MAGVDLLDGIHANRLIAAERVGHIGPRSRVARIGPWLLVDTGEPAFAAANAATPVGVVTAADVATAAGWFGDAGALFHCVVRSNADDALRRELTRLDYESSFAERTLVLEGARPPAYVGPLSIREVTDFAGIEAYGGINWQGDLRHIGPAIARTALDLGAVLVLGEFEGRPVACSMAVVTDDVVGLYNVSVDEAYRRRGFGTAITWAAVDAGLRRGAKVAWMGATDIAYDMYRGMGFEERFVYEHRMPPQTGG